MKTRSRKKCRIDLLAMPDVQKYKLIREVRENLRQKAAEAKLWTSLLETENLTINGETVHIEDMQLSGLSLKNELLRGT